MTTAIFRERLQNGLTAHGSFRTEALTHFKMYGNEQWDKKDKDALQGQERPALVFNKVTSIINAVSGSEITNRFETRFLPRTADDERLSEILTEVVRYIRQTADVEHEESGAFRDCLICGLGCTEFWKDYSDDIEGIDRVDSVPIFEMVWDSTAKRMNLSDGRYIIRGRWIDGDEAITRWPESKAKIELMTGMGTGGGSVYPDRSTGEIHDQTRAHEYDNEGGTEWSRKLGKVLVHEYQYYEFEKFVIWKDPISGEDMPETPEEDWAVIRKGFEDQGIMLEFAEMKKKRYYTAFYIGEHMLEEGPSVVDRFTYKFITGLMNQSEDRVEFFGLMKIMRDPQRWLNKMMSQIVYIVSTNPKGAIITEKGVFDDINQARTDWSKPNPIIETNPNTSDQFQIVHGKYPDSQDRIMNIAKGFVSESVGVSPYFMGDVDDLRRTAGSAITSVQQQAMVVLSVFFDSLRRYRKEAGRMHLEFIRALMPEGQIIRVSIPGAQGQMAPTGFKREWVEGVKYDIVVDEAPVSVNAMREFWDSLQQTASLELLVDMGLMSPDVIADIVPDVPTTIRERMKLNALKNDAMGQAIQAMMAGDEATALDILAQVAEQQAGGTQQQ